MRLQLPWNLPPHLLIAFISHGNPLIEADNNYHRNGRLVLLVRLQRDDAHRRCHIVSQRGQRILHSHHMFHFHLLVKLAFAIKPERHRIAQLDDGIAHTFVSTAVSVPDAMQLFSIELVLKGRSRTKFPLAHRYEGIIDTMVQLLRSFTSGLMAAVRDTRR